MLLFTTDILKGFFDSSWGGKELMLLAYAGHKFFKYEYYLISFTDQKLKPRVYMFITHVIIFMII